MTELAFHRLAAAELRSVHAWYAARDNALAARFLEVVDQAITRIRTDPDSHAIDRKHFRRVRVRRFPYVLIFEHQIPGRVLVVAVAHTSRRSAGLLASSNIGPHDAR